MNKKEENTILKQYDNEKKIEVGLDEAGRGCLFGPVCIAAVIWPKVDPNPSMVIKDSKKCSEKYREKCYDYIIKNAVAYSIKLMDHNYIDKKNILETTIDGMHLCLDEISGSVDTILVDGNSFKQYYSSKKDVYLEVIDMWENQTQELLAPAANEDSSAKAIKKLFNLLAKQLKIDGSFFNCLPTLWAIARHDDDFKKKMQKVYNRFQRFIELIILRGIESKEFVNLKPDNAKTPALSLILNFEGIFWFNIFNSKYVDAEKYIEEISSSILYVYTQRKGEK